MATITAQILVGHAHPNHGGVTPTHRLYLSENSRPAWILAPETVFAREGVTQNGKITWIPTVENMLEDALLMIAIHVVRDPTVSEAAERFLRSKSSSLVTLYEDIDRKDLEQLYEKCRAAEINSKLVLTIMDGSTVAGQLKVLEKYRMDVEVCTPRYSRSHSQWHSSSVVRGSLDDTRTT